MFGPSGEGSNGPPENIKYHISLKRGGLSLVNAAGRASAMLRRRAQGEGTNAWQG
jgi:hypothetical protein